MAGLSGITLVEISKHLEIPYSSAWSLMTALAPLPYMEHADKLHSARMDLPLWKLRTVDTHGASARASLATYYLTAATLMRNIGLTNRQLRTLLGVRRSAMDNLFSHLASAGSSLPLYKDRLYWKVVTDHWIIAREHDLQQ